MKKYLKYMFAAAFVWMALLPVRAEAAGTDAFQIDESGNVTIESGQAAEDGAASLQFSLKVDSADAANIEFWFRESRAKVQEFRYDPDTKQLNIYIAGTEALFAENTDSLTLGTIVVLDRNGGSAAAAVSVVENSFAYVHGTELKTVDNMASPGIIQMGAQSQPMPTNTPAPTPRPPQNPSGGNNNSQGNNNNSQGNNNNSQGSNNNATQGSTNNNPQGNNNTSQGNNNTSQGNNNASHGNNNTSQGSVNNTHGNNSSQGSGGVSSGRPNSSQGNNNGLPGTGNSSQSSSDSTDIGDTEKEVPSSDVENEDDLFSSVWNPAQESTEPTQAPEASKGTNWLLVLVIVAALVIAAAVAAGAAVLYKKQNQLNNRRKR